MPQSAIFGPFFATIALTVAVWVYMYVRRIAFIVGNAISPDDLAKPGELARLSPPAISNPSDNLKNLFEIPVLFYALALYLYVANEVDAVHVWSGWAFVALRTLHSLVHCTVNKVIVRFWLYFLATLVLWSMAARAALSWVQG